MAYLSGFASDPGRGSVTVTPSDSVDLTTSARAVYVTGAGTLKVTNLDGTTDTVTLPANYRWDVQVTRIWSNGTTCTGIHAIV